MMRILFTSETGKIKDVYFPNGVQQALSLIGEVVYNPKDTPFTPDELAGNIANIDVCLTHWSCPTFTKDVLENANRLKLIVHAAGSVADLVTEQVYERGIKVCSANTIMARYVAEGVLADILSGLRLIPQQAYDLKYRKIWQKRLVESQSLYGAKVGLVGLGTIGRFLIPLLEPFQVQIKVYDPYISPSSIQNFPRVELASLQEVLEWGDVISIHASLTQETRGLLNEDTLKWIQDGALLVNTARGAIVDEKALIAELNKGRFNAVLDVFETEPLPGDSPFRSLDNVILLPHVAGITAREGMSYAMIEEIQRFSHGEPLQHEIPFEAFKLMTKEH
jgi:phosphoglycerate dehydrogenase-like enzyme